MSRVRRAVRVRTHMRVFHTDDDATNITHTRAHERLVARIRRNSSRDAREAESRKAADGRADALPRKRTNLREQLFTGKRGNFKRSPARWPVVKSSSRLTRKIREL